MTKAITFSHQNDVGSRATLLCIVKFLVVVVVLIAEFKCLY